MNTQIERSDGSTLRQDSVLANQPQTINVFGDKAIMDFMLDRTAAIFQVPADDMKNPDVQGSLIKAAQLCWTYGAMPGKHVYLIPFRKNYGKKGQDDWRNTYAVSDSYEWRNESAHIIARLNRWAFQVEVEQLTPSETRDYLTAEKTAGSYTTEDRGFRARVLLAHEIDMAERKMKLDIAAGEKVKSYNPPWHYGFWRKEAAWKEKAGKWDADNVPSGRTRDWVAMKRAEKSALAERFPLQSMLGWDSKSEAAKRAAVEDATPAMITVNPQDRALLAAPCSSSEMADFMHGDELVTTGNYEEIDFSAPKATPPAAESSAPTHYPESWARPAHAQDWAVKNGYCKNPFEARNSWVKVVQNYGIFSRQTACDVYQAFYERQLEKGAQPAGK